MKEGFHTCGQRISIVGTTESGKTTLAQKIAQHFQIPHIELDALYWEPNWTVASEQEELWNGNRESIWKSFCTQESILLWMLQTYRRNREKYPALFQQPEYVHLSVVHLQSPQITNEWLLSFQ